MKIKNVSGVTKSFSLGKVYSGTLACGPDGDLTNGATATFADGDAEAEAQVALLAAAGTIDILSAPGLKDLVPFNTYPDHILVTCGNGTAKAADDDAIVIAGTTFTLADASGTSVASATALKALINADADLAAAGVVARDVINSDGAGTDLRATLVVDISAHADPSSVTVSSTGSGRLTIARVAAAQNVQRMTVRTTTGTLAGATGATLSAVVHVGLRDVQTAFVFVRTSAGVMKAFDGVTTVSGALVAVDWSGATDIAATDTIVVFAFGY